MITGYVVDGADPADSDAFTIRYVYLTDPLKSDGYVNARVSNAAFKAGALHLRFQSYRETDSPYDDRYAAGWKRSSTSPIRGPSEWYHRWVILAPVRAVLPTVDPTPSPTPSPTPGPSPTPTPAATPPASVSPTAEPSAAPSAAPASPSPVATLPQSASPSASPSAPA